jgi:Flp pilus assembly protein protease CpaA
VFTLLALGRFGWNPRGWGSLPLLTALALIVVLDLRSRIIPDVITVPAIVYALLLALALGGAAGLAEAGVGVVAAGGLVWSLAIVSRGGIGGGDIKLMAVLGAALGWKGAFMAFALSQIAAGIVVLVLIITRRRAGEAFPVGALIALFGGLILIGRP